MNDTYPLITVVTVCRNAEKVIEATMRSVLDQTYQNIEYIIVDGASTDGTMKVVESVVAEYPNRQIIVKSEPDTGIYNAMNKGIKMATGEWINFMNAGDTFASKDVLSSIFSSEIPEDTAVIYGDSNMVYSWGVVHSAPKQPLKFGLTMPFTHQSSFVKCSIMGAYLFNEKFKSAADMNFLYSLFMERAVFQYFKLTIVNFAAGGISDTSRVVSNNEVCAILRKGSIYRIIFMLRHIVVRTMKYVLPRKMSENILKWKYRKQMIDTKSDE